MKKDNLTIFNFMTNVFILILLFLSGLSYADTNGIWQFANDTRPGVFGIDEGADFTNNYTFINPVYFNLGLYSTGLSTFTDLRTNLFNANSATIATQLTLTGFNCNANSKLRTDAFGNVVCSPDNVNDVDFVVGNEYPIAGAGITITVPRTVNANDISPTNEIQTLSKTGSTITLSRGGGSVIDSNTDTFITTQTCPVGQVLKSVGKNSKVCVVDAQGVTVETDPQVGTLQNGKWCTSNGVTVNCNSATPSAGITTQTCPTGQILKSVGTNSKTCVNDQKGITVEADTLTSVLFREGTITTPSKSINLDAQLNYLLTVTTPKDWSTAIWGYGLGVGANGILGMGTGAYSAGVVGGGYNGGTGVDGYVYGSNSKAVHGIVMTGATNSWAGYFEFGNGVWISSCTGCSVLSEMVQVIEKPINGEVLCIDKKSGNIKTCLKDKSSRIKGIAQINAEMVLRRGCSKTLDQNGSNGMSLGGISPKNILEQPECKGWYPVALSGLSEGTKVVCSTPSGKRLEFGDILVSSNVKGHLRPLDNGENALSYQIVGRADSICKGGLKTDLINVWIN